MFACSSDMASKDNDMFVALLLKPQLRARGPSVHLWSPSFRPRTLCSSRPPAQPGCTLPARRKAARCPGCPVRPAARSSPGSCCRTGTPRRWTPCWSRWRSGARSGCRVPQSEAGLSSYRSSRMASGEKVRRLFAVGWVFFFISLTFFHD